MKHTLFSNRQHPKKNLNRKLVLSAIRPVILFALISYSIMILSMRGLTDKLLLDNLQPLARQSAHTIETNLHLLADRMMRIAKDTRLQHADTSVLDEARTLYELHTIGLYDVNGHLISGDSNAPATLDSDFFSLLKHTDNLTTNTSTIFQDQLGITMGMPIKQGKTTSSYVVGVYKYDILDEVLNGVHVGTSGQALILGPQGQLIADADTNAVLQGTTLSQIRGNDYQKIEAQLTSGATGAMEASSEGETMFLSFSPIRGTQWSLVIELPKSDYQPLINHAILLITLVALVLLALSMYWSIHIARTISKPIHTMTQRMTGLSDGDLRSEVIQADTGDELELLSTTLDHTISNLNQYIAEIDRVLEHIASGNLDISPNGEYKGDFSVIRISLVHIINSMNETMRNFRTSASQLNHMAMQLKDHSAQLYQDSTEQNNSATQLVHEVSDVRNHLHSVTNTAEQTQEKASDISQLIDIAGSKMNDLSQAMDSINTNAQNISHIAKAIEDIAAQTNILAINASVEAARSGAAGKGFAVVAGEVRALAAKSAEAARSASAAISNTRVLVEDGVSLTAQANESVSSIVTASTEINGFTKNLFQAVQQQESALTTMEDNIATISEIANHNQQSAEEFEHSSSMLSQEAEQLQNQVQKFQLKEVQE